MEQAYERFLRYIAIDTTSDEQFPSCPSTPGQLELARLLADEMRQMGVSNVRLDEFGYVYGFVPASPGREDDPVIGLISHMDTSNAMPGANIKPRIVKNYDGGVIVLNEEKGVALSPAEFDFLPQYAGKDLIVTDGTTLLGADDKAGIAEILTAAQQLLAPGAPSHGPFAIAFTPDEEIGRGADHFDVAGFGAAYAYTLDGGAVGEIEYETFNATAGRVVVHGVSIHPGSARGKMKNSILMGMEFQQLLPVFENPACTDGYEGFFHLTGMSGNEERTELHYIIRDHDREKFNRRKALFEAAGRFMNEKYGLGTVELTVTDTYYNMQEVLKDRMDVVDRARRAMEACGITPVSMPVRGGTDGSRLSFMGLPCPNLFTGGHNGHGRHELVCMQSMDTAVQVIKQLLTMPHEE